MEQRNSESHEKETPLETSRSFTTAVEQRYFSLQQAATYTGFSCKTLYRWAETGSIPAIKKGRLWRFDKLQLDLFMQTPSSTEI